MDYASTNNIILDLNDRDYNDESSIFKATAKKKIWKCLIYY